MMSGVDYEKPIERPEIGEFYGFDSELEHPDLFIHTCKAHVESEIGGVATGSVRQWTTCGNIGLLSFDKIVGGLTVRLKLGLHPRPAKELISDVSVGKPTDTSE